MNHHEKLCVMGSAHYAVRMQYKDTDCIRTLTFHPDYSDYMLERIRVNVNRGFSVLGIMYFNGEYSSEIDIKL